MAEGYEPYHVPQQSRRDKLRVVVAQNHQHQHHHPELQGGCASAGLLPLYDPSSLFSSSDLLQQQACANNSLSGVASTTHEAAAVTAAACSNSNNNKANNPAVCAVKEEGPHNLMGTFVGGGIVNASSSSSSSSAATHHHSYLDPHHSLPLNPTSIHDINGDPFLYSPHNLHNLRDFDHHPSYNAGGGSEVEVFKPEPSTAQGLSLSLSSNPTHQVNLPLELNLQRYGPAIYGGEKVTGAGGGYIVPGIVGGSCSASNEMSRSSVPLGPFTGYASILKGSRFLKPAQQLLEELCDVGRGIYGEKMAMDSSLMDPPVECFSATGFMDDPLVGGDGGETRRKKSRLISMLDEVYRRYKQYFQQMQAVVASFECVAGLGNAAPFANLALKALSKHFRSLKIAITDQLHFNGKAHGPPSHGKEEAMRLGNTDRSLYSPRPVQNSGFIEHQPVWRPQRGLPERAVTVLRAWLFEHFLHPYPTDTDKLMLAKQTGLSRSQVSNWFINARVRLWKPMVEEIHMLETRQAQKSSQREERNANKSSDQLPQSNAVASDNPSSSVQRIREAPSKRTRNVPPDLPLGGEEQLNLSYNHLPGHPHIGVGVSMPGGGSGVSLTLGLHQNNGIGLSEPFSISAAQRFGLGVEANNEGYVMGGFGGQSRHFGRDVIGGQLLHDFVG